MNALWLAGKYLNHHRGKACLLVASLVLVAFLPAAIGLLTAQFQRELSRRSASTPMVVGRKGSRYDLTLATLYFTGRPIETLTMGDVDRVSGEGRARAIPLLLKHRARGFPVVGTTLDYFDLRSLTLASGTLFGRLGDCVVGGNVARRLGLSVGDYILTDSENVFDIAGQYPLRLRVVGILGRSFSPDDDAIFVDVKTAWIIEGIGHGHQDVAKADEAQLLERDGAKIVASAAITSYTEITDENIDSFHFHGDPATFPISAILVLPTDDRSAALLAGQFLEKDETLQILRPAEVFDEMLSFVFRIRRFFEAQSLLVGLATLILIGLVILLSIRLRERELATLFKLGCARGMVVRMLAWEWFLIATASAGLVALSLFLTVQYAPMLLRLLLFP